MAQTRKKRRRKHRGTQGGRIDDRPRGKPRNRAEARQRAQNRRAGGRKRAAAQTGMGTQEPSWGRAARTSVIIAALLFVSFTFLLKQPVASTAILAVFMLVFYIPMAYYLDRWLYERRQRKEAQERLERHQQRGAGS